MLVFPIVHLFSIFAGIKKKKIRKLYWFLFYVLMLIVKRAFCLPVLLNLKDKTFESPLITYIVLYGLVGRAYFIVHILSFFRFRHATNGSYFLFLSARHVCAQYLQISSGCVNHKNKSKIDMCDRFLL